MQSRIWLTYWQNCLLVKGFAIFPILLHEHAFKCESNAGTGYGSHKTGSTAENAKSYIPGTDANRESRQEQGRDTGRDSSYTGTGNNQGYGSSSNTSSNTGGGGFMSYIPGTEANRQSRAEHGQDPNTYSSGNQGYGNNNTGGGVMSYIPGTEANRVSRAENGQDPNTYRSGSTNTGEACCPCAFRRSSNMS